MSKEREDLESIWMVDFYEVGFLGTYFGVRGGVLSQRRRLYEVDQAMNMTVH